MYKFISANLIALMALLTCTVSNADLGIGRSATKAEIAAWDIDVRPDFKGLPEGSGSVERGQDVWDGKCAVCHGSFAESNEVFTPIAGGTTKDDIKAGRVKALVGNTQPHKTTLMKVATLSSIWDYIHRAMPWNAPKSLSNDEVFAVTAYLLSLAEIIPSDFVLSDKNISEVQKLMPNRNGMTLEHGLRTINGKPDVNNSACMKKCEAQVAVRSKLPDSARNSHGNIQLQNRNFGAVRGVDTTKPSLTGFMKANEVINVSQLDNAQFSELQMAKNSGCLSCHGVNNKVLGPGFNEVAKKYQSDTSAKQKLVAKVMNGGSGNWGSMEMPAQKSIAKDQVERLVQWILDGAK